MEEEEQIEKAKKSFESILLNDKYSNIIGDDQHLSLLLSMLSLKAGDTLLDVGTGAGYLAFPLAKGNPDCQIIGLDIPDKVADPLRNAQDHRRTIDRFMEIKGDGHIDVVNLLFEK